ncbi:MAG: hypothetical protein ACYDCQ_11280 [Dehalococcoidia bacterium]
MFADEAGNFDFKRGQGASEHFILTTVTVEDFSVGDTLLTLRRQLAWDGVEQATPDFHATEESQLVRDRVFAALKPALFRVDATIIPKRKIQPHVTKDEIYFYKLAWYLHLKALAPKVLKPGDELLVIASSLGTKKKRTAFHDAVRDVITQTSPTSAFQTASWSCASDPCLWVADFCCWAIQRKWQLHDERSHMLIKDKIKTEYEAFTNSTHEFY